MQEKKDLRNFALIWSIIFILIALVPLFKGHDLRIWSLIVAVFFTLIGFIKPEILSSFYKIWMRIGEFIGGIISKIMLFILYFFIFTPIAFVLRLIGKDMLNKKIDKSQKSYWNIREIQPESMKNQF